MNPHVKLATVTQSEISPAEWQARLDLAATYRLIAHYGWACHLQSFLHAGAGRGAQISDQAA
jgi:predicted thioesterase